MNQARLHKVKTHWTARSQTGRPLHLGYFGQETRLERSRSNFQNSMTLAKPISECVGNPGWESTCAAGMRCAPMLCSPTALQCAAVRCGGALWRCAVAVRCGGALWRFAVAVRCGGALWRAAVRCGVSVCCGAFWCFGGVVFACKVAPRRSSRLFTVPIVVVSSAHGGSWLLVVPAATPLAWHKTVPESQKPFSNH